MGVSVTGPDDLWRMDELVNRVPERRVLSLEPYLEFIKPEEFMGRIHLFDWVIVGPQTKPYVEADPYWVAHLVGLCKNFDIPLFMKKALKYPIDKFVQQYPKGWHRTGKEIV